MTADLPLRPLRPVMQERESWDGDLRSSNPLGFSGYAVPEAGAESVRTALISLHETPAVWIDCDFTRAGGTMGAVAGERIVRAFDRARALGVPVVETVSSGGVRLQEGLFALLQMPRTASAIARHRRAGLTSAAYLRSPTTGGVYASFASLTDLRAAEPSATIGFAGPRVVAQVTGQAPPPTSHTAESAFRAGLVDALVSPAQCWPWLAAAVGATAAGPLELPPGRPGTPGPQFGRIARIEPYPHLVRARGPLRPSGLEWAALLTDSWVELAGPDPAVRAGLATVEGRRVVVVAMDRFAGLRRPGYPGPGAYRLAQRAIRLAGRLGLPVIALVDTPGADPAPASEAGGVAAEIARTLLAMAESSSVTVSLVVGEAGSGGAMALAHADRLLMLAGSAFPVIGPEAGAVILYRDAGRAAQLATAFRLTPPELLQLGVVDEVVEEDVTAVRAAVVTALDEAAVGYRDVRADQVTASALAAG